MAITKPYFRIYRNYLDDNFFGSNIDYVTDPRNLQDIHSFSHAYHLLEMDLKTIFDYINPSNKNKSAYSHRIYELFFRACTEFENNASSLLKANGYFVDRNMTIDKDYVRINKALRLDKYVLKLNIWENASLEVRPFLEWSSAEYQPLKWYKEYNLVKHDRSQNFHLANLENLINAVAGVAVILFAQFNVEAFSPFTNFTSSPIDGYYTVSGSIFNVKPHTWDSENSYEFDWDSLKNDPKPFEKYPF